MDKTLAILKLATKFGDKKDIRDFCGYVQIVKNQELNETVYQATDGHIAIRITQDSYDEELPTQLSFESIEKAYKVDAIELLNHGGFELRFPPFDKIFRNQDRHAIESATFNCKYLLNIAKALESFRKDLKLDMARLTFNPLSANNANIMTMQVEDIKIEILLMPVKG